MAKWGASADRLVLTTLALHRGRTPDWIIASVQAVTRLGDPGMRSVLILFALAWLALRQAWRSAVVFLATVAIAITAYSAIKEAFARVRPEVVPWLDHPVTLAYPSGHAAGTMVVLLLGALLIGDRRVVIGAVCVSGAIGLTRVMLGVHWPSDVVGGWMFGAGTALMGYALTPMSGSRTRRRGR